MRLNNVPRPGYFFILNTDRWEDLNTIYECLDVTDNAPSSSITMNMKNVRTGDTVLRTVDRKAVRLLGPYARQSLGL
jgi:hypothetical protein